jgi:uncharacterized protein
MLIVLRMRIGILSDTHGFIDNEVLETLRDVDEIWHAGDIGDRSIVTQIEALGKPVVAVFGNIDPQALQLEFPKDQFLTREGVRVWMRHIVGNPKRYRPEIIQVLQSSKRPDLLVCGHSHILEIARDAFGVLFVNPGAVGHHGLHQKRSLVRLTLEAGQVKDVEVVDFGARGRRAG